MEENPDVANAVLLLMNARARREAADRTVELGRTQTAHADLSAELADLRTHSRSLEEAQRPVGQPSYHDLGERIGTMSAAKVLLSKTVC